MVGNPVVHFEIMGKDAAKLREFYTSAFGWTVDANNPMEYGLVNSGEDGALGGGIAADEHPRTTIYIAVPDPAAALEKIKGLGGTVVQDVTVIPGMVTMALFTDPEGNVVGLVANEMPPAE